MSALPSRLKSPTWTSTQVGAGFQVAHRLFVKEEPEEIAAHHWPFWSTRPMMSSLPSPLKSPTFTSTQVTAGDQLLQKVVVKDEPDEIPAHQDPPCITRPT